MSKRLRGLFSAEQFQYFTGEKTYHFPVPGDAMLDFRIRSTGPFNVWLCTPGEDHPFGHSEGGQLSATGFVNGCDRLMVSCQDKSQVFSGYVHASERNVDPLDYTPSRVMSSDDYTASLSVEEQVKRAIARYGRPVIEGDGTPEDDLAFEDEDTFEDFGPGYAEPEYPIAPASEAQPAGDGSAAAENTDVEPEKPGGSRKEKTPPTSQVEDLSDDDEA